MKNILTADNMKFYWNEETHQVMYTEDDEVYGIIGYAESELVARDVAIEWI